MAPLNPITNFKTSSGGDMGNVLVSKDYLISVYPQISQQLGIPPQLWSWGFNGYYGLGIPEAGARYTPITTFSGGTTWKQIFSGTFGSTLAIKTDGTLWGWGYNNSCQLGTNDTIIRSTPVTTFAGGTNWLQASAGQYYSLALKTDGTLWVWGNNYAGQLATNDVVTKSTPVTTFSGGTNWKQIYAGVISAIAIKTDGTLWTWGNNANGSLGTNDLITRSTPVTTFVGGTNWKVCATTYYSSSAIKTDGTLWTWGSNTYGSLGRPNDSVFYRNTPVTTFTGGTNWADTATGAPEELYTLSSGMSEYSAAIKTDGTLWLWGNPGYSKNVFGTNDGAYSNKNTPLTTFSGGTTWKQVSSGDFVAAAVKTDGTLWVWGNNQYGQYGTGNTNPSNTPITTFTGGTTWKQVSVGQYSIAATKTDGTLWTWGNGQFGQLGKYVQPVLSYSVIFTPVTTFAGGTNWADTATGAPEELYTLSAGNNTAAAIKTDGTLWTWGYNNMRNLGTNDLITRSTPVTTFTGGTNWKQISTVGDSSIAIKTDGTLWHWGSGFILAPTNLVGATTWKQASNFYTSFSAVKTDGTLWVWYPNVSGSTQTFTGDTLGSPFYSFTTTSNYGPLNITTPITTFVGGTTWKQVSNSTRHVCAIKTDGTLWTWGNNQYGQLGYSNNSWNPFYSYITPVTTFAGGTNWADTATGAPEELYTLSAGQYTSAAIKTDGTLWVWGNTASGSLGNAILGNINSGISTPITTFSGGTNWKQISFGDRINGGIKTDGTLWVWGYTSGGALGNAITANTAASTPITTFSGGTNWKQISYSVYGYAAAIKTDGTLWVWGNNYYCQLGNALAQLVPNNSSTPVTTFAGGTNWKQVSAGGLSMAAIKTDGTLWTWGYSQVGALGTNDNTPVARSTPVTTFAGGTNWKQVSITTQITSAIKTDGTLWIWGNNASGLIGTYGPTGSILTPVTTFAGGTNWKQVSVYQEYSNGAPNGIFIAAVKTDGTLWTWGNNQYGQLGVNDIINRSTPVTTFMGGTNWKQVSCGNRHVMALRDNGVNKEIFLFGSNLPDLQIGRTDIFSGMTPTTTFAGGTNWKQVSCAGTYTLAIKTDGTLWTWGNNFNGQLGVNDELNRSTPVTTFVGGTTWKQASGSLFHSAAVKTDGTLWTWGSNSYGALGSGDVLNSTQLIPNTTFAGGTTWKQVSCGYYTTLALRDDTVNKELYIWGQSVYFSTPTLGIGDPPVGNFIPSTTFSGGTTWKQVSCGSNYMSAIKTDGTLWVWGDNSYGQFGTKGVSYNISTPVTTFIGGTTWKQVSCGLGGHTTAVKTDGTLWCWGNNGEWQLGYYDQNYTDELIKITPVTTFAGGTNWADTATGAPEELYTISGGTNYSAAIKTDGTLWVWGNNQYGQLGTFNAGNSPVNTPVTTFSGGTNWKQVSCAVKFLTDYNPNMAGIKSDGTLWIWGSATYGALGNYYYSANYGASTPITTFAGGTDWKQVSVGYFNAMAIKTDGTLWGWGYNLYGYLGAGSAATTIMPTPITTFAGGTNWKQVSMSKQSTLAVKTDGTLWGWGNNFNMQLGTNDGYTYKYTPVTTFAGGTNWKQVSSGASHSAAIKTDGTLWVWGNCVYAQLGISSVVEKTISTPVTTFAGGTNWKQVSCGEWHTTAIKTDGTLWVWGNNTFGQLGTFDTISKSTPVTTFAGGTNWKQVSSSGHHTVALNDDGVNKRLFVFGTGQLTDNYTNISYSPSNPSLGTYVNENLKTLVPNTTFSGGTSWKQVSSGESHTASVKTDGTLWAWGNNNSGQLGNYSVVDVSTPITTFAGGTTWKQVSSGLKATMALRDNGVNKELFSFGGINSFYSGFVATGDNNVPSTTFAGGTDWKQISTNTYISSAVKTDGTLWVWGPNNIFGYYLGLGTSDTIVRSTPVTTFAGGKNWKQVSVTDDAIAALKTDGTLWCWGNNYYGTCGVNDFNTRTTPVTTFAGGTDWKRINYSISSIFAFKSSDYY